MVNVFSVPAPFLPPFVGRKNVIVPGEGPLPEEQVEVSLRVQALSQALLAIPERERTVVLMRYGLEGSEPRTLEEIGRCLGLTRERVRQIEVEALRQLSRLREMQFVAH